MTSFLHSCHAVVPTAGTGSRLGGDIPKQLRILAGKPMLAYALEALIATPEIQSIWMGLSPSMHDSDDIRDFQDAFSATLNTKPNYFLPTGGATRQETVLNTLEAMLNADIPDEDWVLVHDAARPGITPECIQRLIYGVTQDSQGRPWHGGILAMPLADTLKQSGENNSVIEKTIARDRLWQAQTPQMFRLKDLHTALKLAIDECAPVTDEASAMERLGAHPLLIEGATRNFKVTQQADWDLMSTVLSAKPMSFL